jgi:hypothetical protein
MYVFNGGQFYEGFCFDVKNEMCGYPFTYVCFENAGSFC